MFIADSHCDTLTTYPQDPFQHEGSSWNIDKFYSAGGRLQVMAVCTYEDFSGDSALRNGVRHIGNFYRNMPNLANVLLNAKDYDENKVNIILSLEGASPLINDIENLFAFHKLGVRLITLTWNHRNYLADGIYNSGGLTCFGREVVKEMERLNMVVDVSHLNDEGFEDLINIAEKPFVASHSNCRAVYDHPRNLTDDQILEIKSRNGFVGLNFYNVLLGRNGNDPVNHFLHHVEHLLELGMDSHMGFGSDFDGADDMVFSDPYAYHTIEKLLFNDLLLDKHIIEKLLYKNFRNYIFRMI
jgi:membrane dipeptidase